MGNETQDKRIVEGYLFDGENDALLASQEKKKIDYLETHMDYSSPATVLMIYKKALAERIFKTPVGYEYLKSMQQYLNASEEFRGEEIPPIKLYVNFEPRLRKTEQLVQKRIEPAKKKQKISMLPISILLNIVFVIAVILMFKIATNSEEPNILNYETAIINKYASWEQEISQREKVVREKEKELKISNN